MKTSRDKYFSLLLKPASTDCNLSCAYCFYLDRSRLYPQSKMHRMSEEVLEKTIASYVATEQPQYIFGWQGGEPTLLGLDFFRRVVELEKKYGKAGCSVGNGLQTNALLIDEEWGNFLCEIYDQWIKKDTRRVSVRLFDSILAYLTERTRTACKMGENCCQYFVVEYNGDIYPCDFFVQPELKIGNVRKATWNQFRESTTYLNFGKHKGERNPHCQGCEHLVYCLGDCLKNRFPQRKDPRQLSSLCKGWKMFYGHALPGLQKLAEELKREGQE